MFFNTVKRLTIFLVISLAICDCNLFALNKPGQTSKNPLISAVDSAESIKTLVSEIDVVLQDANLAKTDYAVAVYSLDNNKYLYKKNTGQLLTPASNTKIVTGFTAMSVMGKDFKIHTDIYTDGKIRNDSILKGNLYIVGRGDALFTEEDLEKLVLQLKNRGIKKVEGNIYADGSFFDKKTERMEYSGDRDRVEAMPPVTALSIEKNTATVVVSAGSKRGDDLSVRVVPNSEAFITSCTGKVTHSGRLDNPLDSEHGIYFGPVPVQKFGDADPEPAARKKSPISIKNSILESGMQKFIVSGNLTRNKIYSYRYFINDPLTAVAGALKTRMRLLGIKTDGNFGKKKLPGSDSVKTILLASFSRPIIDLLYPINKESNNYMAENLYKLIGAYSGFNSDNAMGAREIEQKNMMNLGIPCPNCILHDGSGLSRRNLITAEALLNMLIITSNMNYSEVYENTLPIAGIDGTLEKRMRFTASEANLRAKTGTLRNVSALSGYVNSLDNEKLAFVMIFNGPNVGAYKEIENQIGILLSQFFYFNEKY